VSRASRHIVDRRIADAERPQLSSDGNAQVDERLVSGYPHDRIHSRAGARDFRGNVAAHFEATRADARTDRDDRRAPAQALDARPQNPGDDPSPSGMDGSDVARCPVADEDRHAIRDTHADGDCGACSATGRSTDDRVRFRRADIERLDGVRAVHLLCLSHDIDTKHPQEVHVNGSALRKRVSESCLREPARSQNDHGGSMMPRADSWYQFRPDGMRPQDPFIGRAILNGQFQILQKIGSGGMGAVYKALEPDTNRLFGVKILHPKLANRKDLVSRFRREARALRQLTHPNTVKVFDYGELDDGALYIVMEFLEGKNLNQTVRAEGPFDAGRALPILVQVCGALDEAHRAGIVHRDLKPENIFLVQSGGLRDFPKVLDFGLAKVGEQQMQPGSVILTQKGMVFGTPEFMSPEQAQGKVLTSASDIYSLAVILYEVLTGKLPFHAAGTIDYIHLHVTAPPVPLNQRVAGRTFPPPLESIIARALAKRPEERFVSASEFATALQAVLDGTAQVSTPPAGALSPSATVGLPQHEPPTRALGAAPVGPTSTVRRAGRRARVRIAQGGPRLGGGPDRGARRAVTQPNVPQLVAVAVAFLAIGVALALALTKYVIR